MRAISPLPQPFHILKQTSNQNFEPSLESLTDPVGLPLEISTPHSPQNKSCELGNLFTIHMQYNVSRKLYVFDLSKKTKGTQVSLAEKIEGSVEITQKLLCVYRLSKGRNLGLTEYSNLELSGNNKGAYQLTEEVILQATSSIKTTISAAATTLHLKY